MSERPRLVVKEEKRILEAGPVFLEAPYKKIDLGERSVETIRAD